MITSAAQLRGARQAAGWTLAELAERSGLDEARLAILEAGGLPLSATDRAYLGQALAGALPVVEADPGEPQGTAVAEVAAWFSDFVDDALYLERRAARYRLP